MALFALRRGSAPYHAPASFGLLGSTSQIRNTAATTLTLNKPTGPGGRAPINGERLILIAHKSVATGDWTTPTGFTTVVEEGGTADRQEMWTRVIDGTEPASWLVQTSSATGIAGWLGLFPASSVEAATQFHNTSATSTIVTGSIAAPSVPGIVIAGAGDNINSDVISAPAGYTNNVMLSDPAVIITFAVALSNSLISSAPGVLTFTRTGATSAQKGSTAAILVP